jgi:hypothetical protein
MIRADDAFDIAITFLSPERFERAPQVGIPIVQNWTSFAVWLATPTIASDKRAAGAWCPAALPGGAVKGGRGPVALLVADVDECTAGAIERTVDALSDYAGIVVPTFSAALEKPKHRIVLRLTRPILPDEFPACWARFARVLDLAGIVGLDRGCKNINRLYFACVAPGPAPWRQPRTLSGRPVDVDAMVRTAAEELARERAEQERARALRAPVQHRDRYVRGALDRARVNIDASSEGGRHDTLLREAYSLARLSLSEREIADALLEPFVAKAGEHRRREAERAIRDAVAARGAA